MNNDPGGYLVSKKYSYWPARNADLLLSSETFTQYQATRAGARLKRTRNTSSMNVGSRLGTGNRSLHASTPSPKTPVNRSPGKGAPPNEPPRAGAGYLHVTQKNRKKIDYLTSGMI
jgi:hypothetical protein